MSSRPRRWRVALDTDVLLHALLCSDGKAKQLRQAWQDGHCQALIGAGTAEALMTALACPVLRLGPAQQHELLADFLPYAEVVTEQALRRGAAADPGLGWRLASTDSGPADCLVSDRLLPAGRPRRRAGQGAAPRLLGSDQFLAELGFHDLK